MYFYPSDSQFESDETVEIVAFWRDLDSVGPINDCSGRWLISEEWAAKFRMHLQTLMPLAERGNVWAQYGVASICMLGCRYTSNEEQMANCEHDLAEMTRWLVRAARQGCAIALDNLISAGYGAEAERVRSICHEIEAEKKAGKLFPEGEVMRRAYGVAISEKNG
jgi:hypothetical protein